jgi:hypothetical protein
MEVSADLQHLQGGAAGCSNGLSANKFSLVFSVPVAVPGRIFLLTANTVQFRTT